MCRFQMIIEGGLNDPPMSTVQKKQLNIKLKISAVNYKITYFVSLNQKVFLIKTATSHHKL